jgi:hypothetical protein
MFPSPCGEKIENYQQEAIKSDFQTQLNAEKFPSPCGEKIENYCKGNADEWDNIMFPSPCGEKIENYMANGNVITWLVVSVPLRGKDRKLPVSLVENSTPLDQLVSVPLRGKDRKLLPIISPIK